MLPPFALARPSTLAEAFAAYDAAGGDAAWYAGGTELLQVMKMGLARFGTLIDLKRIGELRGITVEADGSLVIAGGETHRAIERSDVVRRELPALVALEAHVANIRVRNQGTLAGNLCFAEPHSDPATFLMACGARVRMAGPAGTREQPIGEFVLGPFATSREPDEILTAVVVPPPAAGEGRAYEKAKFRERPAVSVAVRLSVTDGAIGAADVAVGSLTEAPLLLAAAADALVAAPATPDGLEAAAETAADAFGAIDAVADLDGSADYKRHLARVLFARAARVALTEATAHA